jgi:hypothetical protein
LRRRAPHHHRLTAQPEFNLSIGTYFLLDMRPFWGPGPLGTAAKAESFWLAIDMSGGPAVLGQGIAENQWRLVR